jgi:hypothetical protein
VALCAHLSGAPPAAASNANHTGSGEEGGLHLPMPSPAGGPGDMRSPDMMHSRRPPASAPNSDAADSATRRRSVSIAGDGSDASQDPTFTTPTRAAPPSRGYNGGPAPSNLQGMLGTPSGGGQSGADGYSGNNANTAFASTPQKAAPTTPQHQHDGGYSSRRYSTGGHLPSAADPQFSKNIRAPYAGTPQKYPSPSSSPPTGNTGVASAVAGFFGGATAGVHSSQVNSSPAAATMGMVGNLIAYVFNPSPGPSAPAQDPNRSYGGQGKYGNAQHGRSFSADRAVPPNFAGYAGGNGGPITPPNSASKGSRNNSDRRIREDHFSYPQQGSASMEEDDFVMISKSASEERKPAPAVQGGGYAQNSGNPRNPSYAPPSSTSVSSSSSGGTNSTTITTPSSAANSSGAMSAGAQRNSTMIAAEYDMEHDAHANERAAVQAFYASIVQRCQVYSVAVAAITALGDQYVREGQAPVHKALQRRFGRASTTEASTATAISDEDDDSIAGFLQPSSADHLMSPYAKQVTVDRHLVGCSLYLHALSILTRLMKSFENNAILEQPELKRALPALKEVSTTYLSCPLSVNTALTVLDLCCYCSR